MSLIAEQFPNSFPPEFHNQVGFIARRAGFKFEPVRYNRDAKDEDKIEEDIKCSLDAIQDSLDGALHYTHEERLEWAALTHAESMQRKSGFGPDPTGGYQGHSSVSTDNPYSHKQIPTPVPIYTQTTTKPWQPAAELNLSSSMIRNQPSSSSWVPYPNTDYSRLSDTESLTADHGQDKAQGQAPQTSRVSFVPEGYNAPYFGPGVPRSSIPHADYDPKRTPGDQSLRPRSPSCVTTASSVPPQPAMHQSQYTTQPQFLASARQAPPPTAHQQPWLSASAWHQQVPPTGSSYQQSTPMSAQSMHPGHPFPAFQPMPAMSLRDTIGLTSINVLIDGQVGHDPTKPLPDHIKSAKPAAPAQYNGRDRRRGIPCVCSHTAIVFTLWAGSWIQTNSMS